MRLFVAITDSDWFDHLANLRLLPGNPAFRPSSVQLSWVKQVNL
jgi:hypothetical protein